MSVIELHSNASMTPSEALTTSQRAELKEVLVIAYDKNDCLYVMTSGLLKKDVLWLMEQCKIDLLDLEKSE